MKKILLLCSLLACSLGVSYAQTTAVTATVVDSDGTTWANGKWSIAWTPGPSNPNINAYTNNGAKLSNSVAYQSGTLNGSGVLSVTVYDSSVTFPTGSGWALSVCSNTSAPCSTYNFSTAGGSQDISAALTTNIAAPRFKAVSGTYGYVDTEATLSIATGATYWNVTSAASRCYSGSAWGVCSSGGGNATTVNGAAVPASQGCVGTNSGSQFIPGSCAGPISFSPSTYTSYGDSITACNNTTTLACYPNRIAYALGIPQTSLTNQGFSGDQACDVGQRKVFPNDSPVPAALQPLRTVMIGTNDVDVKGAGAYEATFIACEQGYLSWLGTPLNTKVLASAATSAGTCANDTTYPAVTGEACTAVASTITFSGGSAITTTGGPIYIWARSIDGDAGTYTYSVDGGTAVPVTTALTTPIATQNAETQAPVLAGRVAVAAGSHTVAFTQTHSGTMPIIAIGTPSNALFASLPYVFDAPVINQLDGQHQAAVNAYRADTIADLTLLQGDGLDLIQASAYNYVAATTAAGDMETTGLKVHPNSAGHGELAAGFFSVMKINPLGQSNLVTNYQVVTSTNHTLVFGESSFLLNGTPGTFTCPPTTGFPTGYQVQIYNVTSGSESFSGCGLTGGTMLPGWAVTLTSVSSGAGSWVPTGLVNKNYNSVVNQLIVTSAAHTVTASDSSLVFIGTAASDSATFPALAGNTGLGVEVINLTTGRIALTGVSNASDLGPGSGILVRQVNGTGTWYVAEGWGNQSATNCAVNSVSPAACGAATAGAFVVPTTTTTYTVNTTAVSAKSRIVLQPISFAADLPSAPTCVAPAITTPWTISGIVAGTSFTFALPSTTGQTCWYYTFTN